MPCGVVRSRAAQRDQKSPKKAHGVVEPTTQGQKKSKKQQKRERKLKNEKRREEKLSARSSQPSEDQSSSNVNQHTSTPATESDWGTTQDQSGDGEWNAIDGAPQWGDVARNPTVGAPEPKWDEFGGGATSGW